MDIQIIHYLIKMWCWYSEKLTAEILPTYRRFDLIQSSIHVVFPHIHIVGILQNAG